MTARWLLIAALLGGAACERGISGPGEGPSLILINGRIITMDGARRIVSALAVDGERIVAVGTDEAVLRLKTRGTHVLDLQGRAVLPGIVDAHTHLLIHRPAWLTMDSAQTLLLAHGITSLALMTIMQHDLPIIQAYHADGRLEMRTSLYLSYTDNCGVLQGYWWQQHPPTPAAQEARLRITGIKLFADGGSCGLPAVSQEFAPGAGLGDLFLTAAQIAQATSEAELLGHQVVVHAIGDRAVRAAQDGLALGLNGRANPLRHRIDHNTLVPEELAGRYTQLGVVPVLFGYYHHGILEPRDHPGRHGCPPLERNAFFAAHEANTRMILDRNPTLPVAWQGDDPGIPPTSPFRELYHMVTRSGRYTQTFEPGFCAAPDWLLATRITVEEGLAMMTRNSAWAIHREHDVGSLEVGKLADLLVMSEDPLGVDPEELWMVHPRMTVLGGRAVRCWPGYEADCAQLNALLAGGRVR